MRVLVADHARHFTTILVGAAATFVALAIATAVPDGSPEDRTPAPTTRSVHVALGRCTQPSKRASTCPAGMRETLKLTGDVSVSCVRGHFPGPATFVVARYSTTEDWE